MLALSASEYRLLSFDSGGLDCAETWAVMNAMDATNRMVLMPYSLLACEEPSEASLSLIQLVKNPDYTRQLVMGAGAFERDHLNRAIAIPAV